MSKIEDYVKEIPDELRSAIRALASDYRLAIFVALRTHGELSFSDVQGKLGIDKGMLNYHFKKLTQSGLVHHYFKHELGAEQYSFYALTQFGQNFLENLQGFLQPPQAGALVSFFDTGLGKQSFAKPPMGWFASTRHGLVILGSLKSHHREDYEISSDVVGTLDLVSDDFLIYPPVHPSAKFDANSSLERLREKPVLHVRSLSQ